MRKALPPGPKYSPLKARSQMGNMPGVEISGTVVDLDMLSYVVLMCSDEVRQADGPKRHAAKSSGISLNIKQRSSKSQVVVTLSLSFLGV